MMLFPSSTSNEISNAMKYWYEQNPNYDIFGTITTSNIGTYYQAGAIKFNDTNPNLPGFAVAAAVDNIQLGGLPNTKHAGELPALSQTAKQEPSCFTIAG